MAFKKRKKETVDITSPQSLFMDIKNKSVDGLLSHQDNMISEYLEKYYNEKDVALELPTGSGKTLVGLLIGEYRRRKEHKKVVYLCPTKQLVNQVVEQSKDKYGIKTTSFTGRIKEYSPMDKSTYVANESIAVTTYSSFFNHNTFFKDADILIFDDAHSADSYISQFWSIIIEREHDKNLYMDIANILKKIINDIEYERMINGYTNNADREWVDKIPMNDFNSISEEIVLRLKEEELEYANDVAFKNIGDYMHACNMFISASTIIIKPLISPTQTFRPFFNVTQRIYMSATLGESGELERIIGVDNIKRIGIPRGWDKQGFGRRFFIFPDAKFSKGETEKFIIELMKREKRSVVLVPSENYAKNYEKLITDNTNLKIYRNADFAITKQNFVEDNGCVAILANRFDGIDFAKDECRLLFIDGVPTAVNLQERFFSYRMATSILFNERVRTRLTQAIGRCNRGMVDYATVCIIGTELERELVTEKKREYFHPELQAEIQFGYDASRELDNIDDAIENHEIFIKHDEEWEEQENEILDIRNKKSRKINPSFENLKNSASFEVKYQYAIWDKDYGKALKMVNKIISLLDDEEILKGYRGYWSYIAASIYIINGERSKAKELQYKALACTKGITWLSNLLSKLDENNINNYEYKNESLLNCQIENIEKKLLEFLPGQKKFNNFASTMMKELRNGGTNFEHGIEMLGQLLGFVSKNIKKNGSPDTYWILPSKICLISECKIKEKSEIPISISDIREAKTHKEWLVENKIITENTITYTVFISNSVYLNKDAKSISKDIFYINYDKIVKFAEETISNIKEIFLELSGEGNVIWREHAIDKFRINKFLTEERILEIIRDSLIINLKEK